MQDLIARLRAGKKNDDGFTLIELLVVVVIIGVLVAIAVPVYLNYRQGAADKSAQSDVRGAISAVEQFYTNNGNAFPPTKKEANTTGDVGKLELGATGSTLAVITLSDKTQMGYVYDSTAKTYKICANNTGGTTNKWFVYESSKGGSVTPVTGAVSLDTCAVP